MELMVDCMFLGYYSFYEYLLSLCVWIILTFNCLTVKLQFCFLLFIFVCYYLFPSFQHTLFWLFSRASHYDGNPPLQSVLQVLRQLLGVRVLSYIPLTRQEPSQPKLLNPSLFLGNLQSYHLSSFFPLRSLLHIDYYLNPTCAFSISHFSPVLIPQVVYVYQSHHLMSSWFRLFSLSSTPSSGCCYGFSLLLHVSCSLLYLWKYVTCLRLKSFCLLCYFCFTFLYFSVCYFCLTVTTLQGDSSAPLEFILPILPVDRRHISWKGMQGEQGAKS